MIVREVGDTGIKVSSLCLGTMTFGTPVTESDAVRLVHWALDHGVNFIDTADIYEGYTRFLGSPGGVAERILGVALKGRRAQAVVTSKVGNSIGAGQYTGTGLGRKHILHQIDATLRRLQTDYVDFYELHKADPETPLEESLSVMAELIAAGKVRHWGFSNFDPAQIEAMLKVCEGNGWPNPVIAQPLYNWLERECEEEYLPLCRAHDIAVTPYQPLQGGLLTGKYREGTQPPKNSRALEHPQWLKSCEGTYDLLDDFLRESEVARMPPAQYALYWLLEKSGVASVVVGVRSIVQLATLTGGVA